MISFETLKKHCSISGRTSRKEFFCSFFIYFFIMFFLAIVSVIIAKHAGVPFTDLTNPSYLTHSYYGAFILLLIMPLQYLIVAVSIRRLQDTNRNGGWNILLFFTYKIPYIGIILGLILFIMSCLKGTPGDNRYGPNPYAVDDTKKEAQ